MSLTALLNVNQPEKYKLHAARYNGDVQPLDVFISNRQSWNEWNCWISHKNEFNRQFILSLIDFYPQQDVWLFGGIYEVKGFQNGHDNKSRHCHAYNSILTNQGSKYIGRLKIHLPMRVRGRVFNLEQRITEMELQEIIPRTYSGPPFPGYANVSINWTDLCSIVSNRRDDWKSPLSSISGIYLISLTDGRQYIGSAYGTNGIWSRWSAYAHTKDGGNLLMKEANNISDGKYIEGARFTLLEVTQNAISKEATLERESYWKRALGTRVHGLNAN